MCESVLWLCGSAAGRSSPLAAIRQSISQPTQPRDPAMPSAQQVYTMLGNETLWETAARCHALLEAAGIPHVIAEGVAVCLHGYQRNTADVDMLVGRADSARVRAMLTDGGFSWSEQEREFRSPSGVAVQFLIEGDKAGSGLVLPDPQDERVRTTLEDLPVLTLARLIELKIACGSENIRRTHKDFADVVELIATHNLSRSFARFIDSSLRPSFRELVLRARGGS
jgi:hypothetical protein